MAELSERDLEFILSILKSINNSKQTDDENLYTIIIRDETSNEIARFKSICKEYFMILEDKKND